MEVQHTFHRNKGPFERIISGEKTFEIRLFDEKRRLIKIGDKIKGINRENETQYFISEVTGLVHFKEFESVFETYGGKVPQEDRELLRQIYSEEKVSELGIVIIEFKLLEKHT